MLLKKSGLVKANFPEVKVLMETIFEDDEKVFQSICNGAEGYILKNTPPEEILDAIKEIHEGGGTNDSGDRFESDADVQAKSFIK